MAHTHKKLNVPPFSQPHLSSDPPPPPQRANKVLSGALRPAAHVPLAKGQSAADGVSETNGSKPWPRRAFEVTHKAMGRAAPLVALLAVLRCPKPPKLHHTTTPYDKDFLWRTKHGSVCAQHTTRTYNSNSTKPIRLQCCGSNDLHNTTQAQVLKTSMQLISLQCWRCACFAHVSVARAQSAAWPGPTPSGRWTAGAASWRRRWCRLAASRPRTRTRSPQWACERISCESEEEEEEETTRK